MGEQVNNIKLILALTTFGLCFHARVALTQPITNLPYSDDFEVYAEGTPLTNGINGWYADSADAVVQTNTVYSGTKAAMVPIDVVLSNRFEDLPGSNVWLQMHLLPVPYYSEELPQVPTNLAAMLFVQSNGLYMVHDAYAPLTNWVTITNDVTGVPVPLVSNKWVRLDLYQDYTAKTWTLFADYILLKEDIRFVDAEISSFSGFDIYNGSGATTFLDNVAASYSNPPALGADGGNWLPTLHVGLTNVLRTITQGQNAIAQTSLVWKTDGYYDMAYTNTVIYDDGFDGWLSLSATSGTNTGDIVMSFNTSNLLARSAEYTATIRIDAKDTRFGFPAKNSGQTISVAVKVLAGIELVVSPTNLTQTVEKGNNPTNQTFFVWNDSLPPKAFMDFRIEESISWLSLSKYSGVSTGEQHAIGVMFEDMSGFDGGTKTGEIKIVGWGDTGEGDGVTTSEQFIAVSVIITAPEPPTGVAASDGTDTEKVVVTWNAAQGASRYEVWRHTTFDRGYAIKIAEVTSARYNDNSASPGLLYYYWIHSVSAYGVVGNASELDSGYRALSSPGGLFASAGTYTNKVRLTWSASSGADSYELHRGVQGQSLTNVFHAKGLSYDDNQAQQGVAYTYKVKAKNSRYASALSQDAIGYILSPPSSVTATGGTLVNKIDVNWSVANSATAYEVWRSEIALSGRASLMVSTVDTRITDTSIENGKVYYYWVKAKNATATSAFSALGSGYAASGGVDLSVWGLVIQPNTISTGGVPSTASFRLGNQGTLPMDGSNSTVGIVYYASLNQVFGDEDDVVIGQTVQNITLDAGEDTVVTGGGSIITMPMNEGDYYIFVEVKPVFPSTLVESNQVNNHTMREEPIRVTTEGAPPSRVINDYDGDGISDLVVVAGGSWFVRSVDGRPLAMGVPWGGAGFTPVSGDFDGDGIADFAVYGAGMWFARDMTGNTVLWAEAWGGSGFVPVYGVFSSANALSADLVVYDEQRGAWYVRTAGWDIILWDTYVGQSGFTPVSGDFDGDGIWDIVVYQESSGAWYGRTVAGDLLFWGATWGGPGFKPVMGDYDGDGVWDMALYYEAAGMWFIKGVDDNVIVWGDVWGGPGYTPVFGDYTGDGRADMAVYQEATGRWYIRSAAGNVILWDSQWGGPGYLPVGQ